VEAMQEAGWEIASHGLKWIEYKDFSPDDERAHMAEAIRLHTEVTGERPLGWYTGRCSVNTVDLVTEERGFLYCADSYADDLPYWHRAAGRDQLIVPYTLDANDMRFATAQGFNSGDQFFSYLKDSFDALYAEHPELGRQITLMLCRRVRGLMGMNEDAISLSLYERLGRALQRMTFSHGQKNDDDILFIEISHEDLGKTLGASRQSVSKELKQLESQGMIKVAYGRILIVDLEALTERFEQLLGMEQLAPAYAPQDPKS